MAVDEREARAAALVVGRALRVVVVLGLLAAIGALAGAPAAAQQAEAPPPPAAEPRTSLPDLEDEVMCPICGVTLELATEAPQANQQRDFIRGLIALGLTKDEIKDRLVDEFGSEVLAVPEAEGFDLAAWLVPGLAVAIAGVGIFIGLRRWRRDSGAGGGSAEPPSGDGLDEAERERLNADLARYEL